VFATKQQEVVIPLTVKTGRLLSSLVFVPYPFLLLAGGHPE